MNDELRMKLEEFLRNIYFLNSLKGAYSLIHNSSFIIHHLLSSSLIIHHYLSFFPSISAITFTFFISSSKAAGLIDCCPSLNAH